MERLTVNKSKDEMNMVELAHNCCYAKDGQARYRDYDTIIDARAFARNLIRQRNCISADDEVFTNNIAFDEFMEECLAVDPFNEIGLIALFYRNLWAQADLYERLKHYEDLQEQGRLLELPCAVGDTVFEINKFEKEITKRKIYNIENDDYGVTVMVSEPDGCSPYTGRNIDDFGETIFLSQKEAEKALEGKVE